MYNKIMVPLDGSEIAECVLPHVEAFINAFKLSQVTLVRVVEPEKRFHGEYVIDKEEVARRESDRQSSAKDYLDGIAKRLKKGGTNIQVTVTIGRVTESLIHCAEENNIDLILAATHGRSGVTRWVLGSVADKIVRSAHVPVFLVRAPGAKGGI